MSARVLVKILALSFALSSVAMAAVNPVSTEQDIGSKLYCMCGCAVPLNTCADPQCSSKAEIHQMISTDLQQGKAQPAILQDVVAVYGERVLASPPPKGFNLAAWILPGLGLILGLFLAIVIIRRWRQPAMQAAVPSGAAGRDVRATLEEEMKKFAE